jgi:hypothetical protein
MKPPCKRHELAGMKDECFCPEPYETPFTLMAVVMKFDPLQASHIQPHIQPLLDALKSLPGFVRGKEFTMSMDVDPIDKNEVKLVLEFETRE